MPRWNDEARTRQAAIARKAKLWEKGAKAERDTSKTRFNALKHGAYGAEVRMMRELLAECRKRLQAWEEIR